MHHTSSIALVASFLSLAVASPVEVRSPQPVTVAEIKGKKTFSVGQIEAERVKLQAPALSMYKTYAKYSALASVPVSLKKAVSAIQAGTVQATPEAYDMSYLCPVTIGGQKVNLDFDTGSADLWVYSTLQPSTQQTGHDVYNPGSAAQMVGSTWSITYGDGSSAGGKVYADKVVIGSVTATSQAVEAATSVSSSFLSDVNNDGLLGLAFSNINTVRPTQQTTFFDSVKKSLALPLFTATLKKNAPGSYDFGYIDATKYKGKITYVSVNNASGFWQFTSTGYAIGSASAVSSSFTAIADTGTTLLYLSQTIVTAYYNKVYNATYNNDQGGYIFPCSSTLPNLTLVIGGAKFTVPGSYINYAQISNTACFGGLQADTGIGFSILGDIFLKSQFVVFSEVGGVPLLGFAAQADGTTSADEDDGNECEDDDDEE